MNQQYVIVLKVTHCQHSRTVSISYATRHASLNKISCKVKCCAGVSFNEKKLPFRPWELFAPLTKCAWWYYYWW